LVDRTIKTQEREMAQHDYDLANQAGSLFRADLNNLCDAILTNNSGASAPTGSGLAAYMWWADTTTGWLKQRNAANTAWIEVLRMSNAAAIRQPVSARASNTIIAAADFGTMVRATGAFTQTLTAAATLADGFWFAFRNDSSGNCTIDPNGAELIDGAATLTIAPGATVTVHCTGSAWFTRGRDVTSQIGIVSSATGMTVQNTDAATVQITAGEITLEDSSNSYMVLRSFDQSATITVSGAGGLDTGTEASNTWYYIFAIAQPGGTASALLSLSPTGPTMPGGYTFKALVGAVRNNASGNFQAFTQKANSVYYNNHQNVLAAGTATTWTAVDVTAWVPSAAGMLMGNVQMSTTASGAGNIEATLNLGQVTSIARHSFRWKLTGMGNGSAIALPGGDFEMVNNGNLYYDWDKVEAETYTAVINISGFRMTLGI
jgi:hypothetical protein